MRRPAPRAAAAIFLGIAAAGLLAMALVPRIGQKPEYHNFADQRTWLGIPHFMDVVSNAAFLWAGAAGIAVVARRRTAFATGFERAIWGTFFAFVFLTGIGSANYHWAPANGPLVWDRAPLAVACAALLTAAIADRLGVGTARATSLPSFVFSVGSIFYWDATERAGAGDLRAWGFAQFFPALAIPVLAWLAPPRYTRSAGYFVALGWYAAAKVFEELDATILAATGGVVAGHALKHVAAGCAAFALVRMLARREPLPPASQ